MALGFDISWEAVGALGQWFGAIATFAAVLVAIYTARKTSVIKLDSKVSIGKRVDLDDFTVHFRAINIGIRDVDINSMGILLPSKKTIIFHREIARILPKHIKQSESIDLFIQCSELAEALKAEGFQGRVKLKAYWSDTYGNNHTSKKFVFNVTEWD